jgi:hypothetical protein
MFLLASISVIASAWALVRFYTHPPAPMLIPVTSPAMPASTATLDGGAVHGEIPAPEVEVVP